MRRVVFVVLALLLSFNVLCQNKTTLKIIPEQISLEFLRDSNKVKQEFDEGLNAILSIKAKKFELIEKQEYGGLTMDDGEPVYLKTSQMPCFPGGEQKMYKFVKKHLRYPKEAKRKKTEGVVIVRVIIGKNGDVKRPEIIEGLDPECDKEALRVIGLMPSWIPGRQASIRVPVFYDIKVSFSLRR